MDLLKAFEISGSGLKAERARLNVASMNLANANTTRTIEGGPYKAKSVVFGAKRVKDFQEELRDVTDIISIETNWVEVKNNIAEVGIDIIDSYDGDEKIYKDLVISLIRKEPDNSGS